MTQTAGTIGLEIASVRSPEMDDGVMPCRVCGERVRMRLGCYLVGLSACHTSSVAHVACWQKHKAGNWPRETWKYPDDYPWPEDAEETTVDGETAKAVDGIQHAGPASGRVEPGGGDVPDAAGLDADGRSRS